MLPARYTTTERLLRDWRDLCDRAGLTERQEICFLLSEGGGLSTEKIVYRLWGPDPPEPEPGADHRERAKYWRKRNGRRRQVECALAQAWARLEETKPEVSASEFLKDILVSFRNREGDWYREPAAVVFPSEVIPLHSQLVSVIDLQRSPGWESSLTSC